MISLILTVLNEKENLERWFLSINEQLKKPDEIIVVDGGSEDGTWDVLSAKEGELSNLRIFKEVGNIAHGRNFAIRQSKGDLLVITDAGCIYEKNWLSSLTEPFSQKEVVWSATAFSPWFEEKDKMLIYLIAAVTNPHVDEFKKNWLPSSRSVAMYKDRWQTAGGYPEWVPFCEDIILDKRLLRKQGWPFFVREPLVKWRPRQNIQYFLKQLFSYTRSEGHAGLNLSRQLARFTTYIGVLILLCSGVLLISWPIHAVVIFAATFYMLKFWKRYLSFTFEKKSVSRYGGLIVLPLIVFLGDLAKMAGFFVGTIEKFLGIVSEN